MIERLADPYQWFTIAYVITVIFMIITVIQQKGDPAKTISWVIVISVIPILGIVLYFLIGKNYRKEKIFSRKGIADTEHIRRLENAQIINLNKKSFLKNPKIRTKAHIMKMLLKSEKALMSGKNRVSILNNGKATFHSIIHALNEARHHIHLEYYIIEDDRIGNKIRRVLIRKAKEGVEIRLIYDDLGSWSLNKKYINSLQEAGIETYAFMPVHFRNLSNKINYRNHRKIIVVDGKIGFVGGLNIADRYLDGIPEIGIWRDTHIRIEGEAIPSLQAVFMMDWFFVSKKPLPQNELFFPKSAIEEECLVQIVASGPDSDWAGIMHAYFSAIATAQHSVYISTPYLIPNETILTALKTAGLSGVDVRILLPARSDSRLTSWGTFSFLEELMECGVHIFFYEKGFTHSKLMMVDGVFCSVGTANIDIRSFDQNFEINAMIYDENITGQLEKSFAEDLLNSREINLEEWKKRPKRWQRREAIARILSPML